jgi:hypothetical protein
MAALELLNPGEKKVRIIDIAMRYQYDTQESFSKAFARHHGVPPSKITQENMKLFYPISINVTVQGGFAMSNRLIDSFYWSNTDGLKGAELTATEKYERIAGWARKARGQNPSVFDSLTEWMLDDEQWSADKLPENEQILVKGVFARFKEQNDTLRELLKKLEPYGVVNAAVFKALDRFDGELSGKTLAKELGDVVSRVFADFSAMGDRAVRERFAGNKTGPLGIDGVEVFGFVNLLKECDAQVQWALFMPGLVRQQQNGFRVESFEYKSMPAMRFIGKYRSIPAMRFTGKNEERYLADIKERKEVFYALDAMCGYKSGFDYDALLMHHYGLTVDVGPVHCFWGRFMKADAPVPEGFVYFDFVPSWDVGSKQGPPYVSQFAYATFTGDMEALHRRKGYDGDAMYDVTRNIMLGQGVIIPYPDKYWTAEVFPEGCDNFSTAYMFSAEL